MKADELFIRNIPPIICPDSSIHLSQDFIKEKLHKACANGQIWSRSNYIIAARGEGRKEYIDYITSNDVFKWGIKSIHSTIHDYQIQDLLGPNNNSEEFLHQILEQLRDSLMYYVDVKDKKNYDISISEDNVNNIVNDLSLRITNADNEQQIQELKYEMCLYLHLLNYYDDNLYRKNKLFLSGQHGYFRYERVLRFARGLRETNDEYVILDYWIKSKENSYTYTMATLFYDILKKYGIKWFNDNKGKEHLNYEIMSKYVLLPHRLIGYLYYKNNTPQYYCINNFLAKEWEENPDFEIGDHDIYIPQDLDTIRDNFPYNIIYTVDQDLNYDFIKLLDRNSK